MRRIAIATLLGLALAGLGLLVGSRAGADEAFLCTDITDLNPVYADLSEELSGQHCRELPERYYSGGHQFLFIDKADYHPADREVRMRAAREAIDRSVSLYARWFTLPDAILISGRFPSARVGPDGTGGWMAAASGGRYSCVILVDHGSAHTMRSGAAIADYQRTIAHEYFHCVQAFDRSIDNRYKVWRDESTAEYFSGVAVPDGPSNNYFGLDLHQLDHIPLWELKQSAGPFINYLGRKRSPDAVVQFLRGASREHTPAGDLATLRAIPDVDQLFHDFVKDWFDTKLIEANGRPVAFEVPELPAVPIKVDRTIDVPVEPLRPFMVWVRRAELARSMGWKLNAPTPVGALASWRETRGDTWSALPSTIDACNSEKSIVIAVTRADEPDGRRGHTIAIKEHPEAAVACQCPVGRWRMDTAALRASRMVNWMPGTMTGGSIELTFEANGKAAARYNDIAFQSAIDNTPGSGIKTVLRGTINWEWQRRTLAAAGVRGGAGTGTGDQFALIRRATGSNISNNLEFWSRGRMIRSQTVPTRGVRDNQFDGAVVASCQGSTLLLAPSQTVPVTVPPPWLGTYTRM